MDFNSRLGRSTPGWLRSLVLVGALVVMTATQTAAAAPTLSTAQSAVAQQSAAAEQAGAVARVPVPTASAEALRYYRSGMLQWGLGTLLGFAIPMLILFSGLSGRMWRWCQEKTGWFGAAALFTVLYFALVWLLELPLDFYRGFVRQHAYGLSNQSFGQWIGDSVKALLFLFALVTFAVPGTYAFIRAAPKRWWLYSALAATAATTFIMLIQPI